MSGTVALLHYPWGEDHGISSTRPRTPRRLYRRGLAYRRNPRTPAYMGDLLRERHSEAELLTTREPCWREAVMTADTLLLLYPDAIGAGFRPLERELRRLHLRSCPRVLNGRGREFELDARSHRRLAIRRLLERTMIAEALALTLLAIATPALLIADLGRGRR